MFFIHSILLIFSIIFGQFYIFNILLDNIGIYNELVFDKIHIIENGN